MSERSPAMKKLITVTPQDSVLKARAKMTSHGIRHLPVVDEEMKLIGIVSDRDLRSVMPYQLGAQGDASQADMKLDTIKVQEIMTLDPYTISDSFTLQDVLLQFQRTNVGAFPVINEEKKVIGIISYRDMLRMFIHFLGVEAPGSFLAVQAQDSAQAVQELVKNISEEKIVISSMLVVHAWKKGQCAIFMYLLTKDIQRVRKMVKSLGRYTLLNPLQWFLRQFQPDNLPAEGGA